MNAIEAQVEQEIAARIGVCALLGPEVYQQARDWAVTVPAEWCRVLSDPGSAAEIGQDFYRALWSVPPPVSWWGTELGRRLAAAGVDPGGVATVREAAALLGWPVSRVKREFGGGPLPVRDVLDLL